MMFVCLAHFTWSLEARRPALADLLASISMVATPTFLLISGAMLGLLQLRRASSNDVLARRLFHRGLFLVLFGHFVISFAAAWTNDLPYENILRGRIYVTDVIGLALVLIPWWSFRVANGRLVLLGATVYFATLLLVYSWHPAFEPGALVKLSFVGLDNEHVTQMTPYASPIIPYMALYTVGIGLGRWIGTAMAAGSGDRRIGLAVGRIGLVLMGAALAFKVFTLILGLDPQTTVGHVLRDITAPLRKIPPSPAYLAFFCGEGLLFLAFFFVAGRSFVGARLMGLLAVVGQSSLFVFILQFFVYGAIARFVTSASDRVGVLWFVGSIALIWLAAYGWRAIRGNRLFDVTYRLFQRPATGVA